MENRKGGRMGDKSKLIVLSILTFSAVILLLSKESLACDLITSIITVYKYLSDCPYGPSFVTYTFPHTDISLNCRIGYLPAYVYWQSGPNRESCTKSPLCLYFEDPNTYFPDNNDTYFCERACGYGCKDNEKMGPYDRNEAKCIVCNGKIESEYFTATGDYSGDYKCESACGADPECDEKYPYSYLPDICGEKQLNVSRYCDGSCKYSLTTFTCDSSHACDVIFCGGQTYYCVYDSNPLVRGWKWSTSIPSGFCCSDNDCPAYNSTNHLKMYCDTNTHTCKTIQSCSSNDQCEGGWCCDKLVGGTGNCKQKGTITSYGGRSYICDPPEGFVNSSNEEINTNNQASKKLTLLDLLINPFSYFFKR
jgi:hypothetical protein